MKIQRNKKLISKKNDTKSTPRCRGCYAHNLDRIETQNVSRMMWSGIKTFEPIIAKQIRCYLAYYLRLKMNQNNQKSQINDIIPKARLGAEHTILTIWFDFISQMSAKHCDLVLQHLSALFVLGCYDCIAGFRTTIKMTLTRGQ
eukprot:7576_1